MGRPYVHGTLTGVDRKGSDMVSWIFVYPYKVSEFLNKLFTYSSTCYLLK